MEVESIEHNTERKKFQSPRNNTKKNGTENKNSF